ncbi:MAG: hypothetical protein EXR72_19585 [Myxococcales bacterium]|nr:hypothetical protein [Myxococcales bacterium]
MKLLGVPLLALLSWPATALSDGKRPPLADADFVESEHNRDPFRPFLTVPVDPPPASDGKVALRAISMEELRLVAIVAPSPGAEGRTRAMFVGITGVGRAVERGDRLSRSAARVARIDAVAGKVYLIIDRAGARGTPTAERVFELHSQAAAARDE